MKKILLFILILVCFKGFSQKRYNPSKAGVPQNAPTGIAQATPTDSRTFKYDSAHFVWRQYTDTSELLQYLYLPKYRQGNFSMWINTGGTLVNGVITGGVNTEWVFKNGVADSNLVAKSGYASNYTELTGFGSYDARTIYQLNYNGTADNLIFYPGDTTPADSAMVFQVPGGRLKRIINTAVDVRWFGAVANDGNDDTKAFQKALDYVIKYTTSAKVIAPAGVFNIKNLIMYRKTTGNEYQFVTATLQGVAPVFDGTTTLGPVTVFQNTDTASFILGIEKGRNCLVKDISFKGPNAISPTIQNMIEWTDGQWTNGTRNNIYSPSALIVIDPFHNSVASGNQYPGLSAWYTNSSGGGTSEVQMDGIALRYANVGVMVSPNGSTQNCDNISLTNSTVEALKVAWATGQTQSRNNSMTNIYSLGSIQYMVNGADYGAGQGSAPNLTKCNFAGGMKYLYYIGSNFSGMNVDNSYMENVWSLGKSNGLLPVSFNNTQISMMIPDGNSVFTSPVIAEGAQLNFNSGSIEWFDNNSNVGIPFNVSSISFNGTTLRSNIPINNLYGGSYEKTAYSNVRLYGNNADGVVYDKNVLNIPVNIMRGKPMLPGMVITGNIGETYKDIDPTKAQIIFTENKTFTINSGSHTATFKSSNPFKYQVNEALMTTTGVTYSNSIYSTSSTSLGYISSIAGDSTITLHYVPYGLSGITTYDINIYRVPKYIPRTIGDIVNGSDTIRNVVYDISSFAVGDRIRSFDKNTTVSYGIVPGTYVKYVDLAHGKIAISIPATATANGQIFQDAALFKESRGQDTVLGNSATPQVFVPGDIIWNNHGLAANDSIAGWQCYFPGKTTTGAGPLFYPIKSGGNSYTLPIATGSVLGGIKPDGSTITVNPSTGVATAVGGGAVPQAFYPQSYNNVNNSPGIPDSTTDNTVSINAAIAAAYASYKSSGYKQVVKLSAGVWGIRSSYRDTATVYKPSGIIMYPGVILEGAGIGSTVISLLPPPTGATFNNTTFVTNTKFKNIITGYGISNIEIRDLSINGKISNQINYNLNPYLTPNAGNAYDSCTDAIRLSYCENAKITNVKIDSVAGYSTAILASPNSLIDKCDIGWNINGLIYAAYCKGSKLINSRLRYSSSDAIRLLTGDVTIQNNEIAWTKYNPNVAQANFAGIYIEGDYVGTLNPSGVKILGNDIHDCSSFAIDAFNAVDTNYYTYPMVSVLVQGNNIYRNANAGIQVQMPSMVIQHNTISLNGADSLFKKDPTGSAQLGIALHGKNSNNTVIQDNTFINNSYSQNYAYGSTSVGVVPLLTVTNNTVKWGSGILNAINYPNSSQTNNHGNSFLDSLSNVRTSDFYIDSLGVYHMKPNTGELNAVQTGQLVLHGDNDAGIAMTQANSLTRGTGLRNVINGTGSGTGNQMGLTLETKGIYNASNSTASAGRFISFYDYVLATYRGGIDRTGVFYWGAAYNNYSLALQQPGTDLTTVTAGSEIAFASTGSTAFSANVAQQVTLNAGFTANGYTFANFAKNVAIGTGSDLSSLLISGLGNYGSRSQASGAGTGSANVGAYNHAFNALKNVGAINDASAAQLNNASAISIGSINYALRNNSSATHVGVFGGLMNTAPTFQNAAGLFDNGTTGHDIIVGRNNGTVTFKAQSNGSLLIVDGNQSDGKTLTSDASGNGTWKLTTDTTIHNRDYSTSSATTYNIDTVYFTGGVNEVMRITAEIQAHNTGGDSYMCTKTMFYNMKSGTVTDGTGTDLYSDQYIPTGGLTGYTFSFSRPDNVKVYLRVTTITGTITGHITYTVKRHKI